MRLPSPRKMLPVLALTLAVLALGACGGSPEVEDSNLGNFPSPTPIGTGDPTSTPEFYVEATLVLPTATAVGGQLRTPLPGEQAGEPAATAVPPPAVRAPGEPGNPTVAPDPTAAPVVHLAGFTPPPPDAVPSDSMIASSLAIVQRPCEYQFRDMIMAYDFEGPEAFGPEVARRLSDELLELRPDCAAEGWAPVFSDEASRVCDPVGEFKRLGTGSWLGKGGVTYSVGQNSPTRYAPTSAKLHSLEYSDRPPARQLEIIVHFDRVPLYSTFEVRGEGDPGVTVGGCWGYHGYSDAQGWWTRGVGAYKFQGTRLDGKPRMIPFGFIRNELVPLFVPECENLLRTVIRERVISGGRMTSSDVVQAVQAVAGLLPDVCYGPHQGMLPWDPAFSNGPVGGCPVGHDTGALDDGSFVIHWDPAYTDASGGSACWTMTPEGEWSAYPR